MGDLSCAREPTKPGVRARAYWAVLLPEPAIGWRNIVQMRRVITLAIVEQDVAVFGFANPQSVREHRLKYGLHIARRRADGPEHLRRCGLLFQRLGEIVGALAQLVEQPRVLDGNDRLGGEVLNELDLLVCERTDLHAPQYNGPERGIAVQQGHAQYRAYAHALKSHTVFGQRGFGDRKCVENVNRFAAHDHIAAHRARGQRSAVAHIDRGNPPMGRHVTDKVAFSAEYRRVIRFTQSRRALDDRLEDRLDMFRRAADDAEHLGHRRLPLQRLAQIVSALAQLIEQPRVLDGDHRLGGEIAHQLDLFVGEGPDLPAINIERADHLVVFEHGDDDDGTHPGKLD